MKGHHSAELNGGPGASRPARNFLGMEEPFIADRPLRAYMRLDVRGEKRIQKGSEKIRWAVGLKQINQTRPLDRPVCHPLM